MDNKTSKKILRDLIIFILLIILTFWFIFRHQDLKELRDILSSANILFIIVALFIMLLYFLTQAYNVKKLLQSLGEHVSITKMLKYVFIEFFFSAITPASTGGQPMEVYYMAKDGINPAKSTLALLIQVCSFHICAISLGIICAIFIPHIFDGYLIWLFILGIFINGTALAFMLICIFSKKITNWIINLLLKILILLKANNINEKEKKINNYLANYQESSIFIKNHKKEFIKSIIRVFIQVILYYTIPFFIYKSFNLNAYNILEIFAMQAILFSTVSGIPLPGSIGANEFVFLRIFGKVFGLELLGSAIILNRGINFYLFVIISAIVVIITIFQKKKDM